MLNEGTNVGHSTKCQIEDICKPLLVGVIEVRGRKLGQEV
jgi:hypothetical protein